MVPAKVDGTWRTQAGDLVLEQKYQTFSGTLKSKGGVTKVTDGKLVGDQITFTAGGTQYAGRVNGSTIEGTSKSGRQGSEVAGDRRGSLTASSGARGESHNDTLPRMKSQ